MSPIHPLRRSTRKLLGYSSVLVLVAAAAAVMTAQDNPDRGFRAANSYSISDLETVNMTNGNLMQDIQKAKDDKKALDKDTSKSKEERKEAKAAIDKNIKTLETKLEGTHVVNALLKHLDQIGERNGLKLSDFTLTTNAKQDFAGDPGLPTILTAQAFHRAGEIYIRTDATGGFYRAIVDSPDSDRARDLGYIGAGIIAHEQYHKLNPRAGERPAYQRERDVLQKFQHYITNPSLYQFQLNDIEEHIKNENP